MQAVILAAGMGSRLGEYTRNSTKCMVKIDGISLLERIYNSVRNVGIKKVIIVTGYCADTLVAFSESVKGNLEIEYINNPDYERTNNIYSLWLASKRMSEDDNILFESDLIFDESIVKMIMNDPHPDIVTVSRFESWMDGTVALFDHNKRITSFIDKANFSWADTEQYYKTVNIYKLSSEFFSKWYAPFLDAYTKVCGYNAYYEMVLKVIANITDSRLTALDVTGKKWYEIDTPQDLQTAQTLFGKNKLKDLSKRYGGFWRFPELVDYCYLVNPWFPTEAMRSELRHNFDVLLTQYPSGRQVIASLAGSMFGVNDHCIAVGNGAAELIRIVMKNIGGYYLRLPTFNEYVNSSSFQNTADIRDDIFSSTVDDIVNAAKNTDNIILINPDNPSGAFIDKKDVLSVLAKIPSNVHMIFDESFIDMADKDKRFTLIEEDILKAYPNLIVIKSLSKSYGVAGLRLGVLVSSDKELVESVNNEMPIWNINSFAEYFMQIFGKYRKEYQIACDCLAKERKRFSGLLQETRKVTVYPSQANFIMMKLEEGTSAEFTEYMVSRNVLVKDLSGKSGMPEGNFIRIAIRTKEENNAFIKLLRDYVSEKS